MSDFDSAIKIVLRHEGGMVDNPNDPGGITDFGISLRFLQGIGDDTGDFNDDGEVTADDIRAMTRDQAIAIYKEFWWDKYHYDTITDQALSTKTLDGSVNMGPSHAHKLLQTAVNNVSDQSITCDGVLGPATLAAINTCDPSTLLTAYCDAEWDYYQQLIAKNSHLSEFANGWKNRAYDRCES